MKKIFQHMKDIFFLGLFVALFACVDLNAYPVMRSLDYIFWPICFLALIIVLVMYWRHKLCFLLGILMLTSHVYAGEHTAEICSYYNSYKSRINAYKNDHFKQDEPCDKGIWAKARKESAEYEISLLDAVSVVGMASKMSSEWFSGSCANDLMSLCSEYQRRHPETVFKTVPVLIYEEVSNTDANGLSTSCWPCDMAYVVFTVIQGLSNNLSQLMSAVAMMLLVWGTVFWLVSKAMGMILTSKGGTYFTQIATGLIWVMLAAILLRNGGQNLSELYSKFLSPVMQVGLTISDEIQSSVGMGSPTFSSVTSSTQSFYQRVMQASASRVAYRPNFVNYCGYDTSSSSVTGESITSILSTFFTTVSRQAFPSLGTHFSALSANANNNKTLLTDDLKMQFLCMTQKFYNQSLPLIAIGQSLISFSSRNTSSLAHFSTRFPSNFKMWFVGAILVCIFTFFSFLVAFRIMDIFLKLGFVLVLMPLFIVSVVFPITREYAQKAWRFLFQIIVEFIGLAIAASFAMILLEGVLVPESDQLLNAITAPYSENYGDDLLKAVTKDMTLSFPLLLVGIVILGSNLMKVFPIIVAFLFDVSDSSSKGKETTLMGAGVMGLVHGAYKNYKGMKSAATTAANNPYKTKDTKAKEAEKNLQDKKEKLKQEKQKPNNKKNIEKAQKDVDEAQKKADSLRAQADAEKMKTAPSQSKYVARRFGDNSANAVRKGAGRAAETIEKFGSKWGGRLTKYGGGLVGVPLTLGAKTLSVGLRIGAKATELGLKAVGRTGAAAQIAGSKFRGKAPPPRKP